MLSLFGRDLLHISEHGRVSDLDTDFRPCCFIQRRKETYSSKSRESTLSVLSTDTLRGHELLAEVPERVVVLVEEMLRERERLRKCRHSEAPFTHLATVIMQFCSTLWSIGVHTARKQHQGSRCMAICVQICFHVVCELGCGSPFVCVQICANFLMLPASCVNTRICSNMPHHLPDACSVWMGPNSQNASIWVLDSLSFQCVDLVMFAELGLLCCEHKTPFTQDAEHFQKGGAWDKLGSSIKWFACKFGGANSLWVLCEWGLTSAWNSNPRRPLSCNSPFTVQSEFCNFCLVSLFLGMALQTSRDPCTPVIRNYFFRGEAENLLSAQIQMSSFPPSRSGRTSFVVSCVLRPQLFSIRVLLFPLPGEAAKVVSWSLCLGVKITQLFSTIPHSVQES